jgi:hypothetical protein
MGEQYFRLKLNILALLESWNHINNQCLLANQE